MKLLLITDIHHGEDSNYVKNPNLGGPNYINIFGDTLLRTKDWLQSKMESCDLVVNLGDIIHDTGHDEDIVLFWEAIKLIESNTITKHVFGNHDAYNLSKHEWAEIVGESASYYSFVLSGYTHIVLDANGYDRKDISIDQKQLNWLRKVLAHATSPVIIYIHHPINEQSMENNYYFTGRHERSCVRNRKEVREILEASWKVIAVFSGHTHFFHTQQLNRITYATIPSFWENNGNNSPLLTCALVEISGERVNLRLEQYK